MPDGKKRDVVALVTKTGYCFILDADNEMMWTDDHDPAIPTAPKLIPMTDAASAGPSALREMP